MEKPTDLDYSTNKFQLIERTLFKKISRGLLDTFISQKTNSYDT